MFFDHRDLLNFPACVRGELHDFAVIERETNRIKSNHN